MHRLKPFLHQELREENIRDGAVPTGLGFRGRYVPEELAPFDEVEYARTLDEDSDLVISLAVEEGKIERILMGWAPIGDDDADVQALPGEQLAQALAEHGDKLVALLAHLTSS